MSAQKATQGRSRTRVAKDMQLVRQVLEAEQQAHLAGDLERALSFYTRDVVGYDADLRGPEFWRVGSVGLAQFRREKAAAMRSTPALTKATKVDMHNEVVHIDVKDNQAIALSQHYGSMPDTETRELIRYQFRSVWMLAKLRGTWRITGFIALLSGGQEVLRLPAQ